MSGIILKIEGVNKGFSQFITNKFGSEKLTEFKILNNTNLYIPKGKITALIGGNGAGKTTLFNIISRFLTPESGEIIYNPNGKEISLLELQPYKVPIFGIGRMFQDDHFFPELSIIDNMLAADTINIGGNPITDILFSTRIKKVRLKNLNKIENIFTDLFGKENIFWQRKFTAAKNLSFGQARLLQLARLFMGDYKLILLDEPTSGVNLGIIKQIKAIIKKLVNDGNTTILLIEHNMKFVLDLADFCCFMNRGKIAAIGTPEDVIGNDEVRSHYLGT